MANIFDYLTWRGDIDFLASPFNPVDNVVFCQQSYIPFNNIVPGPDEKDMITISQAANLFEKKEKQKRATSDLTSIIMFKEDPLLLKAMGSSSRFGNCKLFGYVNHIDTSHEVQFSAISVLFENGSCFVTFRGTDFSFTGWKEDFNMSFKEVIPAQIEAVEYLQKIASMVKGPLLLGGHSKGGNLAVYAASFCGKKIQKRITAIYANDAPGFHDNVIKSEGFAEIKNRIHSFIPQTSVVGMLLEHGCDYTVIKSSQNGLAQHLLYSWEVMRNNLIKLDTVDTSSRFVNRTVKDWISNLDNEQREQFCNILFSIIHASQASSLPDLENDWFNALRRMLRFLNHIDDPKKLLIKKTLKELIRSATRNIDTIFKEKNGNNGLSDNRLSDILTQN
jgi:hypothetical protein